jgi:hypothetical protein
MKRTPNPYPYRKRAHIGLVMAVAAILQWDYRRRDRISKTLQCWNLRARTRVINYVAELTGEKQLRLL